MTENKNGKKFVRRIIALSLTAIYCYCVVWFKEIPPELIATFNLVVGFYFGKAYAEK